VLNYIVVYMLMVVLFDVLKIKRDMSLPRNLSQRN
jgi:hypothetical protein